MWGLTLWGLLHLRRLLHLRLALLHHRRGHAALTALRRFHLLWPRLHGRSPLLRHLTRRVTTWRVLRGRGRHGLALHPRLVAVGHAVVANRRVVLRTPARGRLGGLLRLLLLLRLHLVSLGWPLARRLLWLRALRRHHGRRNLDALHHAGTRVAALMPALTTLVVTAGRGTRTRHFSHLARCRHHAGRQLHALRGGRGHGADGRTTVATPAALHHFIGGALRRHRHWLALLQRLGRHDGDATGHATVGVRHRRMLAALRLARKQHVVAVDVLDVGRRTVVPRPIGLARGQRNPAHARATAHAQ